MTAYTWGDEPNVIEYPRAKRVSEAIESWCKKAGLPDVAFRAARRRALRELAHGTSSGMAIHLGLSETRCFRRMPTTGPEVA